MAAAALPVPSGSSAEVAAAGVASPKCSSTSRASRQRIRKKVKGRVHWDEQVIEEHNKERGTRQKIDEPDTPFVRSPQTASDSEGGPASSDDEHRLSFRASPNAGPGTEPPPLQEPLEPGQVGDVDPHALARHLDNWVRSGGNQRRPSTASSATSSDGLEADIEYSRVSSACSSRSSSSAPQTRQTPTALPPSAEPEKQPKASNRQKPDESRRRISLSEDAVQPKPTSDSFKAKRAQHYNEVAALKAFKGGLSESSSGSSSEEQEETTKTNTNTNINQRVSGSMDARPWRSSAEGAASAQQEHRDRAVSFSGESGGESSEEFRNLRQSHYSHEWRQDPWVPATVSSLETNTNTNLNACSHTGIGIKAKEAQAKNPMEASRPPVQFDAESENAALSSDDFCAKRTEHYDEMKAVRRFRSEQGGNAEGESESSEGTPQEEAPVHEVQGDTAPAAANPANPMEPRESCVAFQPMTEPEAPEGEASADAAVWTARRQAHYSEMAAALRSMPPPSDEEDDDDAANDT